MEKFKTFMKASVRNAFQTFLLVSGVLLAVFIIFVLPQILIDKFEPLVGLICAVPILCLLIGMLVEVTE